MSTHILKHEHTCIKCGESYTHSHAALTAQHEQFAFQCPNSDCEWHPSKGSPKKRPETWDADGVKFTWPIEAKKGGEKVVKPSERPTESYKQRSVRMAYGRDEIACKNPDHFKMVTLKPGDIYKSVVARPALEILRDMEPYVKASCPCERAACREAWNWVAPGTLQTEWVQRGTYSKGVGEVQQGTPKVVMPVNYRLSKEQFDALHRRFPDYHFVQVKSDGHDHPISHTITQIAGFEMMKSLRAGSRVLDMHGNPATNAAYRRLLNTQIDTAVCLVTSKDHIRAATKWDGCEYSEVGYIRDMARDHAPLLNNKNVVTSVHTSYYYEMSEISSVLKGCADKATWVAIMHKFEGESGTLNEGELTWTRDGDMIVQKNTATGETYRHPDNSRWFKKDAWAAVDCGPNAVSEDTDAEKFRELRARKDSLAWTKTEVTPGTYRFVCVLVPNSCAYDELLGDLQAPKFVPKTVDIQVGHASKSFLLREALVPLYQKSKTRANYKVRDHKQFMAHCAAVQQQAKAFYSAERVEVNPDELAAIQLASFYDGFQDQVADQASFQANAQFLVRTHERVAAGKHLFQAHNALEMGLEILSHAVNADSSKRSVMKSVVASFQSVLTRV